MSSHLDGSENTNLTLDIPAQGSPPYPVQHRVRAGLRRWCFRAPASPPTSCNLHPPFTHPSHLSVNRVGGLHVKPHFSSPFPHHWGFRYKLQAQLAGQWKGQRGSRLTPMCQDLTAPEVTPTRQMCHLLSIKPTLLCCQSEN